VTPGPDAARPSDEWMHPVGDNPAWSESYYFNFVDPETKIGMFTRMGFRPSNGWADALHVIYLPDNRVLFTYGRREIKTDLSRYDGDLCAGHLQLACLAPHERWQIAYNGPAQDIADPAILLTRSKARPQGWYTPANLDMQVTFECLSAPHYAARGVRGHFEQSGRAFGRIRLDDTVWEVSGYGVRDKSWGPRDWGAGQHNTEPAPRDAEQHSATPRPFLNWFSMNFGESVAMGGACMRGQDGVLRGEGWIMQDGRTGRWEGVTIDTDYAPGSLLHRAVRLEGHTEWGTDIRLHGRILSVCPTKIPMPGGATFVNEGLAEFLWDDRVGYGIAEHWHAVSL